MNDLPSIAKRLRGYADRPGADRQEQQDFLTAADALILFSAMMNAVETKNGKDSRIPG